MLRRLKRVLAPGGEPRLLRECRHCGTTVEEVGVGFPPACGSAETATYEV